VRAAVFPVWLTGLAALGLIAGLGWYLAPLEPNILVLQFAFTPRAFGEVIHAWPAEHLARFRAHLAVDYALLLCYGAFGLLLATRTQVLAPLPGAVRRRVRWALPLAALFDAAENALQLWLTEVPRFGVPLPYLLAATCASVKWLLLLAFALAVAVALARAED
jgi:hypothetical protein